MPLSPDFTFTQSSLQDYVDCARRFELRYIERQRWPAVEAEPVLEHERHMQQGADFHRLVQQHLSGIPAEKLAPLVREEPLARWWTAYLNHGLDLPAARTPETALSAPLGEYRLLAKYDLLAVEPGERLVIVDWKTAQRRPRRDRVAARLQSWVYPYVLVEAGAHLNGGQPVAPEQVTMIYWYAEAPGEPHVFAYDSEQHARDRAQLSALIAEIVARTEFPLTGETRRCAFCTYRSLCDRGSGAGEIDAFDEDAFMVDDAGDAPGPDLDFDQVAEVAF